MVLIKLNLSRFSHYQVVLCHCVVSCVLTLLTAVRTERDVKRTCIFQLTMTLGLGRIFQPFCQNLTCFSRDQTLWKIWETTGTLVMKHLEHSLRVWTLMLYCIYRNNQINKIKYTYLDQNFRSECELAEKKTVNFKKTKNQKINRCKKVGL